MIRRAIIIVGAGAIGACVFLPLALIPGHARDVPFLFVMGLSIGSVGFMAITAAWLDR